MIKLEQEADGGSSPLQSVGTKRGQNSLDGPTSKRPHVEGDDNEVAVKILIPLAAVGAIIGKGGEALRKLRSDHQCRIEVSKSSETYPGTSERICLVQGRVHDVLGVIEVILQKINEKCEGSTYSDAFDHKVVSHGNEVCFGCSETVFETFTKSPLFLFGNAFEPSLTLLTCACITYAKIS
ncbi:unnamed protein product [Haemonchus placei]|uniref:KH domain-containing protein n=1 Tax=Haemonchus placei TaxID=6290 RepID=A0A0N4VUL5_HAEPC|nr:unnamed protein product [Haemonchus placei]